MRLVLKTITNRAASFAVFHTCFVIAVVLLGVLIAGTYMHRTICSKPGPHTATQTELKLNHGPNIVDKSTNDEYFAVELAKVLVIPVHSGVVWLLGMLTGKNL